VFFVKKESKPEKSQKKYKNWLTFKRKENSLSLINTKKVDFNQLTIESWKLKIME